MSLSALNCPQDPDDFRLIGFITALWRASGTIAGIVLVVEAGVAVGISADRVPSNCMVSILTGTSFGTGATMGAICMAMGRDGA